MEKQEQICMNPECYKNECLTRYKCPTDRPIIHLGKKCWNCGKTEYLEPLV